MAEEDQQSITSDALNVLISRRNELLGFIEKRVGSRATADDILQSALIRGIERGGEIRDEESVVAWFYRLLRNAIIDHYRRNASATRSYRGLCARRAGSGSPFAGSEERDLPMCLPG